MNAAPTAPAREGSAPESARRTLRLARFNWLLMVRNRTTALYAFAMPLLPLALLLTAEPDAGDGPAVAAVGATVLTALIFPGYYNLLSMFVTRRDELVLKRLRTGEVRDLELVTSMALPGAAITLVVAVVAVPVTALRGFDLPANPLLLALALLFAVVAFAALAVWTAAWTATAEAAQLTSAPVMVLALAGFFAAALPERWQPWFDLLPGAAVTDLLDAAWFATDGGEALSFAETFVAGAPPLAVLAGWAVLGAVLAARSLRWEPRA